MKRTRNILIGGTSHAGKSSLAASLGEALGDEVLSTDTMARHPGRPWPNVRPHVADFYESLSAESIYTFLRHHHENMWWNIKPFVQGRSADGAPVVLEGSALRPEYMAELDARENLCVCLTIPEETLRHRVADNSGYAGLEPSHQTLVDAFIERSLRDNAEVVREAMQHGVALIDTSKDDALARVMHRLDA